MKNRYSTIRGIGGYLPDKVLSNFDLEKIVDTTDEWIRTRTGIQYRHIAPEGIHTSTMAVEASRKALDMAGLEPKDIDLIVCGTVTPDQPLPATAAFIQTELGARNAAGFDFAAACAGFLYGLIMADKFIKTGYADTVLVIGVELLSRIIDWSDRATCVLFGDGAGAAVVTASEEPGFLGGKMYLDGTLADLIQVPAGGSRLPVNEKIIEERLNCVKMRGREVFRIAVRYMGRALHSAFQEANVNPSDIDWLVPHQANDRITFALTEYMKFPIDRVYRNIEYTGNTSAASIPIALAEMVEKKLIHKGQLIAMTALGAGIAYASALVRWSIDLSE